MSDIAQMHVIGVRELSRQTREVVDRLEANGQPTIITKQGQPVAALIAVDDDRLQDLVLAAAPEFAESAREADEALAAGRTRPMGEILAEMAGEDAPLASASEAADSDPGRLVSEYTDRLARFSAETVRREMPEGANMAKIEQLQRLSAELFRELVSRTVELAARRVQVVTENAMLAGKEHGGIDTSLELLEGVKTAERLTYYSCRVEPRIGRQADVKLVSAMPSYSAYAAAYAGKPTWKTRLQSQVLRGAGRKH
jgi:prevent-host-death family protein